MHRMETILAALVLLLPTAPMPAHSQNANEDLTACGAARPEPSQSATWGVLFCNRTGHDLVLQFRDNDCPADNGNRRGDVYEKKIARGESVTVFLCYARETQHGASPPPGTPVVRIPGGKGVVTTWNVVGDCGDRSDRAHLDARTFYDRGGYETGIILLQYPGGAAHCFGGPAEAAAKAGTGAVARSDTLAPPPPPAAAAAAAPAAPAAPSLKVAAPTLNGGPPAFAAAVDPTNRFTRTIQVFATSAQGAPDYRCNVLLAVTFSDGTNWNDKQKIDVRAGTQDALVLTRKYLKTVTQVTVDSPRCEHL